VSVIKRRICSLLLCAILLATTSWVSVAQQRVVVGSKNFTEGYVLAEILCQLLEEKGFAVERRLGLGGTLVCYGALQSGEIDVYPEYSGTLTQAVLKTDRISYGDLQKVLHAEHELLLLEPFGFNNTYAIALKRARAEELGLRTIGDLAQVDNLRMAFSHEFINRNDGWPGLAAAYGLSSVPRGIEHGLAYQAIEEGKIDVTDVYSTDGDIRKYDLFLLGDDKVYFPTYLAAPIARAGVSREVRTVLNGLAGMITESEMRAMNARVLLDGKSFAEVAAEFLSTKGHIDAERDRTVGASSDVVRALLRRTVTHLKLTIVALLAAMVVAIPLGVFVYRMRRAARPVVYIAGTLQTIPSIALLAFMIPLFGIGAFPAVVALFLYSLLPILRNTATALAGIDPVLKRVAVGMGLDGWQRLRYIELPLAAPTILAGIKTAAVINIGTATLAAFIGAGGLGEPIVTGLALNDTRLILQGAIPAAVLAILTELLFEGVERAMIPRHLLAARPN